jgi:Bacterial low temperature requirement A protein (LtrA)
MMTTLNRRASTGSYNPKKRGVLPDDPKEQVAYYKEMIAVEKAGKRKLFHSLVKLANELRRMRDQSTQLVEQQSFYSRHWHEGGLWRAPTVLPGVSLMEQRFSSHNKSAGKSSSSSGDKNDNNNNNNNNNMGEDNNESSAYFQLQGLRPMAAPISLSDLFFNLVVVTAFTRVGMAISRKGSMELSHFLYFAVFWTVWSKEASYSTRFDTTDLSASITTLVTCFATLFACLSAQAPMETNDGTRIMIMAASVALLHCLLHFRVALTTCSTTNNNTSEQQLAQEDNNDDEDDPLTQHIRAYAILTMILNAAELVVWTLGIWYFPTDWEHRWAIFALGVLLALRIPRAFLSNDFHGT